MTQLIKLHLPNNTSLEQAISTELEAFNSDFEKMQRDGCGMGNPERALLRTYLVWKMHIQPSMEEYGITEG